jgi:hypothetical protein
MTNALAAGLLLLAADTVDPHTLVVTWPDGSEETVAATTPEICAIAAAALLSGLWRPVGRPEPPLSASCSTGNAFAADAFCIHGFTCEKRGRNAR